MKKAIVVRALLLVLLALLVVIGCDLNGDTVSIRDRISRFESDLNNNRSRAYRHLHSDTTDKPALRAGEGWDDYGFETGASHSIVISNVDGKMATGTVTGGDYVVAEDIQFEMKEEESDNWYIRKIWIGDPLELKVE